MHIVINRRGERRKAQAANDAGLNARTQANQAARNAARIGTVAPVGDAAFLPKRDVS